MKFAKNEVLVLKCVGPNGEDRDGIGWSLVAGAEAIAPYTHTPDMSDGLHGWLWGAGCFTAGNFWMNREDGRWLIAAVRERSVFDLGRGVKFPTGRVVFASRHSGRRGRDECVKKIRARAPKGSRTLWLRAFCEDDGLLEGGDFSWLDGGFNVTLTAGMVSMLVAGDYALLEAGRDSLLLGGYRSCLQSHEGSLFRGGEGSIFVAQYWDLGKEVVMARVGQKGILPDVWYRAHKGMFLPAEKDDLLLIDYNKTDGSR